MRAKIVLALLIILAVSCSNQERVKWQTFQSALMQQEKNEKPIMFFFYSTSCVYCKVMEKSTLNNKEIADTINENFIPVKLNIDNKLPIGKGLPSPSKLAATFRVRGVPAVFFVNKEHNVVKKLTGFQPVFLFKKHLKEVIEQKESD